MATLYKIALKAGLLVSLGVSAFVLSPKTIEAPTVAEPPPVIPAPKPVPKPAPVSLPEELQRISFCESGNHQFNPDGSVLRGKVNAQDVGKYQINEFYHGEAAKKLGYDLYTLEGNTAFALHLYRTQGSTPWNWSKPCWGK